MLMVLSVIYLCLFVVCGSNATLLIVAVKEEASSQIDDLELNMILKNISNDKHFCFHCIQRHVGFDRLEKLVANQDVHREKNEALKRTRSLFDILSIFNSVVVFVAFGGPKSICLVSLFSSLSILASLYVEKVSDAILFESSVLLMSVVVYLKTLHATMFQSIQIETRKNR